MLYKIKLDDDSFIVANEEYTLTLFKHHKMRKVTVAQYLINNKFWKYHLVDIIDGKKIKRYFVIEPLTDYEKSLNISVGSRIKYASDIKENDLVLGSDGSPRKVNELHTGEDDMYNICVNGQEYTVNGGHILALVDNETGEHLEIPVNVYMHLNDEFKSHFSMEVVE